MPAVLFLAALAVMAVAFARPQMSVGLPHREGTVILAFDVSNSMQATDLQPTRIDAAKAAAKEFVDKQPSTIKIGVVAFNNGALITQQPTTDRSEALVSDRSPDVGGRHVARPGNLRVTQRDRRQAAEPAEERFARRCRQHRHRVLRLSAIVLLSDGENTSGPDPGAVAQLASTAGVHIFPIGDRQPEGTVLKIDGFNVATALDEQTLKQIASVTNGTYFNAKDSATLPRSTEASTCGPSPTRRRPR